MIGSLISPAFIDTCQGHVDSKTQLVPSVALAMGTMAGSKKGIGCVNYKISHRVILAYNLFDVNDF
jgi:hypothetical protein